MSSYFGFFRGIVKEVDSTGSPDSYSPRGRIKVYIPAIHGPDVKIPDDLPWAEPCFPVLGGGRREFLEEGEKAGEGTKYAHGLVAVPPIDSSVWVGFEQGDVGFPIWFGTWYGSRDAAVEMPYAAREDSSTGVNYPDIVLLQAPGPPDTLLEPTPTDSDPEPKPVRYDGLFLRFVGRKKIELVFHQGQNYIEFDSTNKKIKINTSGWDLDIQSVTVNAGTEETPVAQGGNINIRAFPYETQPGDPGIESQKVGAEMNISARKLTINVVEDIVINSQKGKIQLYGKEPVSVSSSKAIYGGAPAASGFDNH